MSWVGIAAAAVAAEKPEAVAVEAEPVAEAAVVA
jgi:hypothetical protein